MPMFRLVTRLIRSFSKLLLIIGSGSVAALKAFVEGDVDKAGQHIRSLSIQLHDDLLRAIEASQRLIPLCSRPGQRIDRILIVKLDRIGDMVNTTPVFDALQKLFPQARLDLVGHPVPLALLDTDDRIAERIPYKTWLYHALPIVPPGPKSLWVLLKLLLRRYPLVVYLRGSMPFLVLGLTSRLIGARFLEGQPVIDRYLSPLEQLYGPIENRQPSLRISDESVQLARKLLVGTAGCARPRVVIHASASTSNKVWPLERFAELADKLNSEFQADVHFLGSPADRKSHEQIATLSTKVHSYHSSLKLSDVVALISEGDVFIGNDSGLSHIAAAVGTPMVVLWGPVNLDMARPKAPPDRCIVLYHDLSCRATCPETHCVNPVHLECLMRTQVEDVLGSTACLLEPFRSPAISSALAVTSGSYYAR